MKHKVRHIHFVGIGGSGMSGIAEVLANLGYQVSGSDLSENSATRRLAGLGVKVAHGHKSQHVNGADAVVVSTAVQADNPAIKGSLGHLYAISGRQAEARELLRDLTTPAEATDVAFYAALICAGLKETDAALTWLERAVDERSGSVRYLKIDPRLAGLHKEPRYRELMKRVGLSP